MADKIVKLKDGNDYLLPVPTLLGIDTTNLLANQYGVYTATQDCYVLMQANRDGIHDITLNNTQTIVTFNANGGYFSVGIPLKKGDTFGYSGYQGHKYQVYGMKY